MVRVRVPAIMIVREIIPSMGETVHRGDDALSHAEIIIILRRGQIIILRFEARSDILFDIITA